MSTPVRFALPEGAAELIFQVISERNERGSLMVTTNPHIIETGEESWRFRHGLEKRGAKRKGG